MGYIAQRLPKDNIQGSYFEPFVGGGAVFFYRQPVNAVLSDLNKELVELYRAIRLYPHKVWEAFEAAPAGKENYYKIRDSDEKRNLYQRAARTLYLNRTCFKGMWRHNTQGKFNVGYGGEERRWAISHENLIQVSKSLRTADIRHADFAEVLLDVRDGDFVFFDPPYKPGEKEFVEQHYVNTRFSFDEQVRLAVEIKKTLRKVNFRWLMTNSAHPEIQELYQEFKVRTINIGTGSRLGIPGKGENEVLISNY